MLHSKKQMICSKAELKVRCGANKKSEHNSFSPDELENVCIEWFKEMCCANLPIRRTLIREKATRVALKSGIDGFSLPTETLKAYMQKYGWGDASIDNIQLHIARQLLPRHVWKINADKACIFCYFLFQETLS
jgi:hypothetical protein